MGVNLVDEGYQGRFAASCLVLQSAVHGPQLCLGGVGMSYPPSGGGPDVIGWVWDSVPHREGAGAQWGLYRVVGWYDGERFTLSEPAKAVDETQQPLAPWGTSSRSARRAPSRPEAGGRSTARVRHPRRSTVPLRWLERTRGTACTGWTRTYLRVPSIPETTIERGSSSTWPAPQTSRPSNASCGRSGAGRCASAAGCAPTPSWTASSAPSRAARAGWGLPATAGGVAWTCTWSVPYGSSKRNWTLPTER